MEPNNENNNEIVKVEADDEEYIKLAQRILIPLDKAINKIHLQLTIRDVYFAIADARERLIQFIGLPNKEKVKDLMPILLQTNILLNKLTKLPQKATFNDALTAKVIEPIITWRKTINNVIMHLSGHEI
ncbi:MAG: hypothetical protein EAX96_11845 [Candidatus Lokiarchaeota archaeon]|nr:hypothetical protein [Candidatus Lokiarchaeota archaeon]